MTRAPANLLTVRSFLLAHLGPAAALRPGVTVLDELPPAAVGIVGDANHRGGYHCGSDRVVTNDYSVVESPRDRAGLTLDAAALDIGLFRVRTRTGVYDLPHYSRWLVEQCAAGTADTRHIREVIYSPDGQRVRRWDRLRIRSTGDSSHLWHTHESYFRDAIRDGADLVAVKRRYLTHIGLIGDTMTEFTAAHAATLTRLAQVLPALVEQVGYTDGRIQAAAVGSDTVRADLTGGKSPVWFVSELKAIRAGVDDLVRRPAADVDESDIDAIAAAIIERWPADQARRLADELATRLQE